MQDDVYPDFSLLRSMPEKRLLDMFNEYKFFLSTYGEILSSYGEIPSPKNFILSSKKDTPDESFAILLQQRLFLRARDAARAFLLNNVN